MDAQFFIEIYKKLVNMMMKETESAKIKDFAQAIQMLTTSYVILRRDVLEQSNQSQNQ